MKQNGILIVVSGFAGTGKGTIMKELLCRYSEQYALSISMTTRSPRPGEQDGVEYFFTDRETFEHEIANGGLIEHACYCDHYYGTPRAYVDSQLLMGKDVILEIEVQGALQIKEKFPDTVLLFVVPPSVQTLYDRLKGRGTESGEVIAARMKRATEECSYISRYDYILVNDDLDVCVEQMHHIIQSQKLATARNTAFIESIYRDLQSLSF
ncbi:MAG: guanylate kinase [Lachnospiraceae bacterium]|nr:guanylate kinase [Lachnospiraceae bacterium]